MRYQIRQKVFSFGDNFTIRDEYDQDQFIVQGKVFSFGDKLKITDMAGNELVYLEQKLFRFLPEYHIYMNGRQVATVKKEFTFFKPKFYIESMMGSYEIEGNIFDYNFQITKNNSVVGYVSKKWFSFSDTYGVDVVDEENQPFMVALVIVIDQILHDNNHNNH